METGSSEKYFKYHMIVLNAIGIKLVGSETYTYRLYSFITLGIVYVYPFLGISDFFQEKVDIETTMLYEIMFFMSVIKSVAVFIRRKKLGKMLIKMERDPFIADVHRGGSYETKAINRFVTIHDLQTKFYWIMVYGYIAIVLIYSFTQRAITSNHEKWPRTYLKLGFVDSTNSPAYEMMTFYQSLSVLLLASNNTTIDLIIGGALCNITCQLKILQNYIRRIGLCHDNSLGNEDETLGVEEPAWPDLKENIKIGVQYHLDIMNILKEMEEVYSLPFLLVLLNTLAIIGTLIYLTSIVTTFDIHLARTIVELSGIVFQVFIVCYWGDRIQEESQNVGVAAYDVNVALSDLRFQQAMKLINLRSQTPLKITAAKFTDVGLATFAWIMQMSYSAFMMLRRVQLK